MQEPLTSTSNRARLESVDVVRGVIMIIMALDHTRDFFGIPGQSPTNLSTATAALFLTRSCRQVHIIIRGESLANSMSRYLIDEIERNPRITVRPRTQVTALIGDDELDGVELIDAGQHKSDLAVQGLFVFIGAKPSTDWLAGQLAQDSHGFLLAGTSIPLASLDSPDQAPLFLETSRPGVFCVGDVRSGSVKRCATAIGEGSMAVRLVFERLQAHGTAAADPPRADT